MNKKLCRSNLIPTLSCVFIYMLSSPVSASQYIYDYIGYNIHKKSFGDKGVDNITAIPPSSCSSLRFVDVKLKLSKKRYGNASLTRKSISRCKNKKRCHIKVKWHHKAAGIVEYSLQVKWVKKSGKC